MVIFLPIGEVWETREQRNPLHMAFVAYINPIEWQWRDVEFEFEHADMNDWRVKQHDPVA